MRREYLRLMYECIEVARHIRHQNRPLARVLLRKAAVYREYARV